LNNNYNVLSQKDINEIENVLEFANGLILKDTELAESLETMNSYRLSNEYISAMINTDDPASREEITLGYNKREPNTYYKNLLETWGIPILESRQAKHNQILLASNPTLTREETNLFYECWYEVLNYHNKVTNTKAFKNQPMYNGFIKLFLVFSTVQRYLTRKMENFFDIDVYDLRTLKNAFISVGLDYFDDMPINYQRRLLKMVNTLLSHKGTNQAISEIVELFGFENVEIYRYVLAKGYKADPKTGRPNYNDPYLMFFKTPHDKEIDFRSDLMMNYDSITSGDPYWQSTEEEVKTVPFNFLNSKYMSVDTTIDAMNETIGLAYFMSLLNQFQLEYKAKEGVDFGFINKKISKNIVNVYDAIIALQALIIKSHGYKDKINKTPDAINFVYGYRDVKNAIDLTSIFEDIKDIVNKYPNTISNHDDILDFIETFKIVGFDGKETYSIQDFIDVFKANESMRKKLESLMVETDNYYLYRKLQEIWDIEMRSKLANKLYGNSETFSDYIRTKNYDLYQYIQIPKAVKGNEKQEYIFYRDKIFDLTESISNYIGDLSVRRYFLNNNFIGLSSYIEKYLYTLISIFKSYTIDLLSANIVFSFNNKTFNTLKLFDDIGVTVDMELAERVDLLDVANKLTTPLYAESSLVLTDSFKITTQE
jgi:Phage tail protein (Tail_P2_I)